MASPVSHRRLVFSIIYRSLYLLLYVILIGLLVATPADAIRSSLKNEQIYNVWIIAAIYLATILGVTFVYFTRLYINKTELNNIPKGWVPIEKGDVRSAVYKMISAGLGRSATIAYESRPRLESDDFAEQEELIREQSKQSVGDSTAEGLIVNLPRRPAVWGEIEHFGWASPTSPDLPNLQYTTVLSELPNLIEGKALTLAPPDPTSQTDPPILDPDAVALLQRTANMSLRDYIVHLSSLGVLEMDSNATKFLSHYEYARFSNRPISNARFKELMHLFAEILRAMEPLNPDILDEDQGSEDTSSPSSNAGDDGPSGTDPGTPRSNMSRSYAGSVSSSRRQARRQPSTNTWNLYRTAPNSLRSGKSGAISHKQSVNSLGQSRRHYTRSQASSPSLRSLTSGSSGSVIRLATAHDMTELPYILSLRDTAGS